MRTLRTAAIAKEQQAAKEQSSCQRAATLPKSSLHDFTCALGLDTVKLTVCRERQSAHSATESLEFQGSRSKFHANIDRDHDAGCRLRQRGKPTSSLRRRTDSVRQTRLNKFAAGTNELAMQRGGGSQCGTCQDNLPSMGLWRMLTFHGSAANSLLVFERSHKVDQSKTFHSRSKTFMLCTLDTANLLRAAGSQNFACIQLRQSAGMSGVRTAAPEPLIFHGG